MRNVNHHYSDSVTLTIKCSCCAKSDTITVARREYTLFILGTLEKFSMLTEDEHKTLTTSVCSLCLDEARREG